MLQTKKITGEKTYFKEYTTNKYFKMVSSCSLFNNHTDETIYFDIKVRECELKETERRKVPVDDKSKALKTVIYYDLIPNGRLKKFDASVSQSRLRENWIMKDA